MGLKDARAHAIEDAAASLTDDFASSYRSGMGQLVGFFRAKGIGPEEAADLAHETLLKTLVHLKRHGREREDLGPLVRTIARNLVIERVRRAKAVVVPLSEEIDVADTGPGPAEDYLAGEREQAVRDAVRSLSPRHRHVVEMWMAGSNPAEIALQLGIKRNAVDAILHRARRNLAAKLQGSGVLGWVGLLGIRLRSAVRRTAHHAHTMELLGQAAPAATGLAALGLAAVISFSSPALPASRTADAAPSRAGTATSAVTRAASSVASTKAVRSPSAARNSDSPVVADLETHRLSAGTTTVDPTRKGEDGRVAVDVWHDRGTGDDRGMVTPTLDSTTGRACDQATVCKVGP
jgi:RNA polymerase sigma-70 factor, ECF subfamily